MFLQETKTKRGGKTYISYLVRESFRTPNGPRGRTVCNLTHLPKEVRDMVGQALKGEALVPLERIEINNIHGFGGCVVLEEAARRHGLPELLAPLSARNAALVHAMIFGGLLFPPSVAPFYVESRSVRLATFCGLDPERERFELPDLSAALRELDERWGQISALLLRPPHAEARAITLFRTSPATEPIQMGALGMDPEGIPVPLVPEEAPGAGAGLEGFLQQMSRQARSGLPLLTLDQATASRIRGEALQKQPYLIELAPDSLAALLRQLNQAQLAHALREGDPVEVRHHGERYILAPVGLMDLPRGEAAEPQEDPMRMGSLKELTSITAGKPAEPAAPPPPPPPPPRATGGRAGFQGITTNVPAERLPAATAIEWAHRARTARAAFAPVQIVVGQPASGEGIITWRNHQNLQFLTHRLRCHLHGEWRALGEPRPVEEVLRDLQEVHRATLTIDGVVVRRLASHPSKAVAALMTKLNLWPLFQPPEAQKKRGERPGGDPLKRSEQTTSA